MTLRALKFAVALALVLSAVMAAMPAEKAFAAEAVVSFTDESVDCSVESFGPGSYGTLGVVDYWFFVPPGYTWTEHVIDAWGDYWNGVVGQTVVNEYYWESENKDSFTWHGSGTLGAWVDIDGGSFSYVMELYEPGGSLVSKTEVHFDCPGGGSSYSDAIYDSPMVPDPAIRQLGTVIADSPVYSEPSMDSPVAGTLTTVGQTWFAVDKTEGDDGQMWYEIFVGGWNNAWIPASAFMVEGDLGGEEGGSSAVAQGPSGPVNKGLTFGGGTGGRPTT